jgi:hypothetical protein
MELDVGVDPETPVPHYLAGHAKKITLCKTWSELASTSVIRRG